MKILAIETSCDDTGIAILEADNSGNFNVLANQVASQIKVHQKYGGVFPAMAKREHQKNLVPTFAKALKEANLLNPKSETRNPKDIQATEYSILNSILEREPELLKKIIPFLKKYQKPDVDFIAVTNGPGLEPCLWVGVNFARALSYFWDVPLIPVNHIEGHILVNAISKFEFRNSNLPALALVVSGGHTQLVLMRKIGDYQILGETRDDAAGECFDKCAKILGLGYPGGPEISKLAEKALGGPTPHQLPRPMLHTKDYDFSFSGLKTATLYTWQKIKSKRLVPAMCNEVQQAIIDVLLKKTAQAAKDYKAKTLILGGGVSANKELQKQFAKKADELGIKLVYPGASLSTDNGLMITIAAYFNIKKGGERVSANWQDLEADANLRIG